MNTKEIKELVNIHLEVREEQYNINGQIQVIKTEVYSLTCPECGRKILEGGSSRLEVLNILNTESDELYKRAKYCPECGQKLSYDAGVIEREETE